jgi:hypothetical protein
MSPEAAALALQDQAALWSMGEICATDVVTAACNALVAGLDSPALRMLAACTRAEATYDVPDLLPPALKENGSTSAYNRPLRRRDRLPGPHRNPLEGSAREELTGHRGVEIVRHHEPSAPPRHTQGREHEGMQSRRALPK